LGVQLDQHYGLPVIAGKPAHPPVGWRQGGVEGHGTVWWLVVSQPCRAAGECNVPADGSRCACSVGFFHQCV
jgi:hypothetical protein